MDQAKPVNLEIVHILLIFLKAQPTSISVSSLLMNELMYSSDKYRKFNILLELIEFNVFLYSNSASDC